jgi:hypothetical protein
MNYEIIKLINYDLFDYFNLVNSLICNRCNTCHTQEKVRMNDTISYEQTFFNYMKKEILIDDIFNFNKNDINLNFGSNNYNIHHIFLVNKYLKPNKKISKNDINKWYSDTEHGHFHGLMAGFMAYFFMKYIYKYNFTKENFSKKIIKDLNKKNRDDYEKMYDDLGKIIFSCILHDFVRCIDSENDHDSKLKEYFPNLLDETYRHSNPFETDKENILVTADRIELRRYSDYYEWKNDTIHNYYQDKLSKNQKKYLDIFYKNIRPCLLYFYENKNKYFIRHGLECEYDKIEGNNYPQNYFSHKAETILEEGINNDNYAIEIDRFPFKNCSTHSGNHIWTFIKGFRVIDNKLIENGKFCYWIDDYEEKKYSMHYDHLTLDLKSKFNDWYFLLRIENFIKKDKILNININVYKNYRYAMEYFLKNNNHFVLENIIHLLDNNIFNIDKYFNLFVLLTKDNI